MAEGEREARRWRLAGRVQGVAFRYATRETARRLGVVGWVRNLADGSVEVAGAAPSATLEAFGRWLREGPPAARVESVEERRLEEIPPWREFEVRF